MTDRELKKNFKKLLILICIFILIIITLSVYTLGATKADLSICDSDEYANNLQVLGIDEEEFKQYLSIFGNLAVNKNNENTAILDMVTSFISEMSSENDLQTNEEGQKYYDAELIYKVMNELNGQYVNLKDSENKRFKYNRDSNTYTMLSEVNEIPCCINIDKIEKNGEQLEVTYKLGILTPEQMAKYKTGQDVQFRKQNVKATITKNKEYEYSKYFLNNIEII